MTWNSILQITNRMHWKRKPEVTLTKATQQVWNESQAISLPVSCSDDKEKVMGFG